MQKKTIIVVLTVLGMQILDLLLYVAFEYEIPSIVTLVVLLVLFIYLIYNLVKNRNE